MSTPTTLVADRYRLVKLLGAGGMGIVWQAWDERLQRPVALKMLRSQPELSDDERDVATSRAMREARITAGLHHPHAVTVFDVVEHDGQPCLVMQLIDSTPLSALLREHGTLTPRETARIGAQVSSALAAAHKMRIVHRDVKPGNILITEDGSAMISDFGISHALGDVTITATGMLHGTPAYLAPEVARGQPSSFASDVFSLGSTMYAMLEGAPPFGADNNAIALLHRVARGGYPAPRHAGPLAPLLRSMLSADPKRRPDMKTIASRLSAIHGDTAIDAADGASAAPWELPTVPLGRAPAAAGAASPPGAGLVPETPTRPTEVAPTAAQPVQAEPTEAEPVATEPVLAEPVLAEPVAAGLSAAEPTGAEPTKEEPTEEEPVPAKPAEAEQTETAPTLVEPTLVEPTQVEPTQAETTEVHRTATEPTEAALPAEAEPSEVLPAKAEPSDTENTETPTDVPTAPAARLTQRETPTAETEQLPSALSAVDGRAPRTATARYAGTPGQVVTARRDRRTARLVGVLVLLVVLALGAVALWAPLRQSAGAEKAGSGTAGGPTSAQQTPAARPSPTATTEPTTPAPLPTTSPSPEPSPPSATPTAPPTGDTGTTQPQPGATQDPVQAITSYYALLPGDRDTAWPLMTDDYQVNHVGGRDAYDEFWSQIDDVKVTDVSASGPGEAQATLTYSFANGRVVREVTAYRLVEEDGRLKIAATTVLSSTEL